MARKKATKSKARRKGRTNKGQLYECEKGHRIRIRIVSMGIFLFFGVVCARLVYLQVAPDMRFSEEYQDHVSLKELERPRGTIYDSNGRVLAADRKLPSLNVDPSRVTDPVALAKYLAPRLQMAESNVLERVSRTDANGKKKEMVWLKKLMSQAELDRLGDLSVINNDKSINEEKSLLVRDKPKRVYPEKELAAQVLGFVNGEGVGSEGLEAKFNQYLSSTNGEHWMRRDSKGNRMGFRTTDFRAPEGGDDLYLTIDTQLQYKLEQELDKAMAKNNATRSMGLLMDPDTGAILAMATRPAFDPNTFNTADPEMMRNRAVTDFFEPGSAFKLVTASAALELGLVQKNTLIDCMGGSFNPYGHRITDTHILDAVPFWETYALSSNIAIIKVAAQLGDERLESWIRKFGFGQRTGLEVQMESPGYFRSLKKWNGYSMGSLPMGQEIGVTMPQLAAAFSVVANGGTTVTPHLVERAVSQEGEITYQFENSNSHRVISEDTARIMRDLSHLVVTSEDGTGKKASIAEYRVGGKTGTAQIADHVNGGYYKDRYTTVFAGFAPIEDPKVTCVIVVSEPMVKMHYGGHVCGPVFRNVVRDALIAMKVPVDPMDPEIYARNAREFDKSEVRDTKDADTMEGRFALNVLEPSMKAEVMDNLELVESKTDTLSDKSAPIMPSFIGLTKREARMKALELGLVWDPLGAGRVVRQEPVVGASMSDVRVCKLIFGHHVNNNDV